MSERFQKTKVSKSNQVSFRYGGAPCRVRTMKWTREFLIRRLSVDLGVLTPHEATHRSTAELEQRYWDWQNKNRQDQDAARE